MPYAWINIAAGRDIDTKRALMRDVTDVLENVLSIGRAHTHVYVMETALDDVAIGGERPADIEFALVTIAMSRGRPPVVLDRLSDALAKSVSAALGMAIDAVHCVLIEQEASNVSVAGKPLSHPNPPLWFAQSLLQNPA